MPVRLNHDTWKRRSNSAAGAEAGGLRTFNQGRASSGQPAGRICLPREVRAKKAGKDVACMRSPRARRIEEKASDRRSEGYEHEADGDPRDTLLPCPGRPGLCGGGGGVETALPARPPGAGAGEPRRRGRSRGGSGPEGGGERPRAPLRGRRLRLVREDGDYQPSLAPALLGGVGRVRLREGLAAVL